MSININKYAFTVSEVLVAIFIFIIITSIVLIDYRKGENSNILRLAAFDVEDTIRSVQNMTLTGKKMDNQIPGNAYGINFHRTDNLYYIFGDNNDDCKNYLNKATTSCLRGDLGIEKFQLPKNVYIDSICGYSGTNQIDNLDILFYPPRANLKIIVHDDEMNSSYILEPEICNIVLKSTKASGSWIISVSTSTSQIIPSFQN